MRVNGLLSFYDLHSFSFLFFPSSFDTLAGAADLTGRPSSSEGGSGIWFITEVVVARG